MGQRAYIERELQRGTLSDSSAGIGGADEVRLSLVSDTSKEEVDTQSKGKGKKKDVKRRKG